MHLANHMRVVGRNKVFQHAAAAGRANTLGAENIFLRDRDTGQRTRLAGLDSAVRRVSLRQRAIRSDRDVAVELRIEALDALQIMLGQLAA